MPASASAWGFAAILAGVGILASSFRIVLAPGFELYLGPIFYLLAYRVGGLRLALPAAAITMLPSYFWWGHVFSIVMAIAHVLFISRLRRFRDLAVLTLLFYASIGTIGGYLFLHLHYGAPDVVIALAVIRKLLNDLLMATAIDLACAVFTLDLARGRVFRRNTVRLATLLPATITLIVLASSLALFVDKVRGFSKDFVRSRADMALVVELEIRRTPSRQAASWVTAHELSIGNGQSDVLIATDPAPLLQPAAQQRLGCTRIDDGSPVSGPNDRNTFSYWLSACQLGQIQVAGRRYTYLYSTAPPAEQAYRDTLIGLAAPGVVLIIALFLQFFLNRGVARSLAAWRQVIDAFGRPGITKPQGLLFSEFEHPIGAIVAANNRFAALVAERSRLASAVAELNGEMDLQLASEIRFDRRSGELTFTEISVDFAARRQSIVVHRIDRTAIDAICSASEAFVEFRIDGNAAGDWYLLSARGLAGPGRWRSGWIVRLRQSKLAHDRLRQQARLVELGGMASALSHELKQPLFTISLSSENGRLLIDQGTPQGMADAREKFDRISEQVNRSRDIIARISRYSRIEDDESEPVEIGDMVSTALTFMRPLMVQNNVGVSTNLPDSLLVLLPRVGMEQLLVNAVQNAIDAIDSRREDGDPELEGELLISVETGAHGLRIRIEDNGTGFGSTDPEAVFEAFVTTKSADKGTGLGLYISRQIVSEMGGSIKLQSCPPPKRGAVMTIDLPAHVIAGKRRGAMRAGEGECPAG